MRVYGVTGWKNAGKTTLVERLVAEIVARGLSVSTLKHAHHGFDVDQPGRDSHRHRAAGARQVLVEGYKRDRHPKIEVRRAETARTLIAASDPTVEAIATDALLEYPPEAPGLPLFHLDDIPEIADFVLRRVGLA